MASQEGSFPLSSLGVLETWRGSDKPETRRLEYLSGEEPYLARSPFGSGIFAFPARICSCGSRVGTCSPASRCSPATTAPRCLHLLIGRHLAQHPAARLWAQPDRVEPVLPSAAAR